MAESFGSDAERYDRARPRYPEALLRRIVAAAPGPDVLDVGCGTGIAARQLLPTLGILTGLAPDKLAEVLREAGAAVDALGGGFTMRYATVALTTARTTAA